MELNHLQYLHTKSQYLTVESLTLAQTQWYHVLQLSHCTIKDARGWAHVLRIQLLTIGINNNMTM